MKDFEVIANNVPWSYFRGRIGHDPILGEGWEIRDATTNLALTEEHLWRGPNTGLRGRSGGANVTDWHFDGGVSCILLWADHFPTEVRLPSGLVVAGKPGQIVAVNNHTCMHRTAKRYIDKVRAGHEPWRNLARNHRYTEPDDQTIERWKEQFNERAA